MELYHPPHCVQGDAPRYDQNHCPWAPEIEKHKLVSITCGEPFHAVRFLEVVGE